MRNLGEEVSDQMFCYKRNLEAWGELLSRLPPDKANLPPDQTHPLATDGGAEVAQAEARGVPPLRYPHAVFYHVGPAGAG